MSLMSTLGKVAVGIIVAKGVGKIMGSGSSGGSGGGLLGSILGGQSSQSNSSGNTGLGGLADMLGGGASGGGLGGLLDAVSGKASDNPFGNLLNDAIQGKEPEVNEEQESQAAILLRAMVNAAKADGKIDADEQKKIIQHLGEVSDKDAKMVREILQAPLDVDNLINSVPQGMEQQVYVMSLLAINLDSPEEAKYLDQLAKGLNISQEMSNMIHDKAGAPKLYS